RRISASERSAVSGQRSWRSWRSWRAWYACALQNRPDSRRLRGRRTPMMRPMEAVMRPMAEQQACGAIDRSVDAPRGERQGAPSPGAAAPAAAGSTAASEATAFAKRARDNRIGILWMVYAASVFILNDAIVKTVLARVPMAQMVVVR